MTLQPEQPVEKPYILVDFAAGQLKRAEPVGHDAIDGRKLSGEMELYLIARTPVQVANGSLEVAKTAQGEEIVALNSSIARHKDDGGSQRVPIVPGSSLKGALRSLVEALSPSCVAVSSGATRFAIPRPLGRCTQIESLCPACRLFGMSGAGRDNYLGQVSIEDAQLVPGQGGLVVVRIPLLWAPARGRRGLPDRYLRGEVARGRKIYLPSRPAAGPDARIAFKAGSVLKTRLHFENLSSAELGLLVTALGLHPQQRFLPRIGAGKPVGLGSVEVAVQSVHIHGSVAQTGRMGGPGVRYSGDPLTKQLQTWAEAAIREGLVAVKALQSVADALKPDNLKRLPVEGAY